MKDIMDKTVTTKTVKIAKPTKRTFSNIEKLKTYVKKSK